jgi:hypothetical protein
LFKLVPSFGGGQLKKTIEGVSAVSEGKSTDAAGKFQYKVDQNLPIYITGTLFGKYALPEAQKYYKKKEAPKKTTPSGKSNRFKGL